MAATMCMLARGTISWGWLYTASDLAKVFWRTGEFLPAHACLQNNINPSGIHCFHRMRMPSFVRYIWISLHVSLWHPEQFHKGVHPLVI